MDFQEIMLSPAYDFLRTHERLGSRIMLLGLGGSHAYGTNIEGSDIDFRGIAFQSPSDLLGLTTFEQFENRDTDTVIYAFNKAIRLLLDCSPNVIEILGLDEDQYLIQTPLGRELVENKEMFLSKRAIHSFGGYAQAQLRRLENALSRDRVPQAAKEEHILKSVLNALEDFNAKHGRTQEGTLKLYIDKAVNPDLDTEIFMDMSIRHYPLRDYTDLWSAMKSVVNNYDKIGKRNNKKDDVHLNKHAMHLIRLFMMAIDIVEKGEIRTHRTNDLPLLRAIRAGEYMQADGTFSKEFYEILSDYERRLEEAAKQTSLPDRPDVERVGAFMEKVNRKVVMGELEEG